jgi:hypothetical protein
MDLLSRIISSITPATFTIPPTTNYRHTNNAPVGRVPPLLIWDGFFIRLSVQSSFIFVKISTRYWGITLCCVNVGDPGLALLRKKKLFLPFRAPVGARARDAKKNGALFPQPVRGRADYSEAPKGRKYCVPLTGSCKRRRSCCRSALRSTKSISDVLMTSRSDEE